MEWSFNHQAEHLKIANAVYAQKAQFVPLYVLDPMPTQRTDMTGWGLLHQAAHNDFNAAIDQAGNDLSSVDWSKPDQLASWIALHAKEHVQAQLSLGLA